MKYQLSKDDRFLKGLKSDLIDDSDKVLSFNQTELAILKRAFAVVDEATDKIGNDNFDDFEALWLAQAGLRQLVESH